VGDNKKDRDNDIEQRLRVCVCSVLQCLKKGGKAAKNCGLGKQVVNFTLDGLSYLSGVVSSNEVGRGRHMYLRSARRATEQGKTHGRDASCR
jgi:hypothetical protein